MAWKNVQYENGKYRTNEGGGGGSSTFAGLDDVNFSDLQNGQVPKYNSETHKWENADESGGGGTVTDVQVDGVSVVNQQGVAEIETPDADGIEYNNQQSGLQATDVQSAIDELAQGSGVQRNIYLATGQILKSSSTNVSGLGMATVDITNEIARIDFTVKITNASGSSSDFDWGISIDKLREINPNIPNIKPVQGGYYYTNQSNNSDLVGYGCLWSPTWSVKYWMPARYYTTSGDLGGWPSNMVQNNSIWFGCCFGEVI